MPSDFAQGGFGLALTLNGTAIVYMTDLSQLRVIKQLAEITGHDSAGGYYDAQEQGIRRLEPFDTTLIWDALEPTHEAIVAAFASNAPSSFSWTDPQSFETISFNARIGRVGRVAQQESAYIAHVEIRPVGKPTIVLPYYRKVLSTSPIAYWPLWDASGSEAESLVAGIPNGTINGATPGQPGIGDGETSFYFDGSLDWVNIYSSALSTAIGTCSVGTHMIWVKPDTGFWITGYRRFTHLRTSAGTVEALSLQQGYAGDRLSWERSPGGAPTTTGNADTDWFCMLMTWDTGDYADGYKNGVWQATTGTAPTAWADPLHSTYCYIGRTATSAEYHLGWLAHCVLWDYILSPTQILDMATL